MSNKYIGPVVDKFKEASGNVKERWGKLPLSFRRKILLGSGAVALSISLPFAYNLANSSENEQSSGVPTLSEPVPFSDLDSTSTPTTEPTPNSLDVPTTDPTSSASDIPTPTYQPEIPQPESTQKTPERQLEPTRSWNFDNIKDFGDWKNKSREERLTVCHNFVASNINPEIMQVLERPSNGKRLIDAWLKGPDDMFRALIRDFKNYIPIPGSPNTRKEREELLYEIASCLDAKPDMEHENNYGREGNTEKGYYTSIAADGMYTKGDGLPHSPFEVSPQKYTDITLLTDSYPINSRYISNGQVTYPGAAAELSLYGNTNNTITLVIATAPSINEPNDPFPQATYFGNPNVATYGHLPQGIHYTTEAK